MIFQGGDLFIILKIGYNGEPLGIMMIGMYKKLGRMFILGLALVVGEIYVYAKDGNIANNNINHVSHDKAVNITTAYDVDGGDVEIFVGHQMSVNTAQNLSSCSHHFYDGVPPVLTGDKGIKLARDNYELCFDGFGVLYSGVSRTPIYSASYLTKSRIEQARTLIRKDSFHEEVRLPVHVRAMLGDYQRSGYDRGHLSPNGDMANVSEQFDSFSLANIVPQDNEHNRGVWQSIEKDVRNLAVKYGELYVVTGVVFNGEKVASIGGGVLVPSHLFKAVYAPSVGRVGVYYSPNNSAGELEYINLSELTERTGIHVMPGLSPQLQQQAFNLPTLSDRVYQDSNGQHQEQAEVRQNAWLEMMRAVVEFVISLFK